MHLFSSLWRHLGNAIAILAAPAAVKAFRCRHRDSVGGAVYFRFSVERTNTGPRFIRSPRFVRTCNPDCVAYLWGTVTLTDQIRRPALSLTFPNLLIASTTPNPVTFSLRKRHVHIETAMIARLASINLSDLAADEAI